MRYLLLLSVALAWGQGEFQVSLEEQNPQFYLFKIQAGSYANPLADGSDNTLARQELAQALYAQVPDVYQSLMVFTTFPLFGDTASFENYYLGNDVAGIGRPIFDNSASFGSSGTLKNYLDMGQLATWQDLSVAIRGLMSAWTASWAGWISYQHQGQQFALGSNGTWFALTGAGRDYRGGFNWFPMGNDRYYADPAGPRLTPLTLYLLGMIPADLVPSFPVYQSPVSQATPGETIRVTGVHQVDMAQILAANGSRVPAAHVSPKVFRVALIVLTDDVLSAEERRLTGDLGRVLSASFFEETGGLGLIETQLVPAEPQSGGSADEAAATAWLCSQLEDGHWRDTQHTAVRETAAVLQVLDTAECSLSQAITFLSEAAPRDIDLQARALAGLAAQGQEVASPLAELVAAQRADGSWGQQAQDWGNPLTTAMVLTHLGNLLPSTSRDAGLAFLVTARGPEGHWIINGQDSLLLDLQVALALAQQQSLAADDPALADLASLQGHDGGFGNPTSQVSPTLTAYQLFSLFPALATQAEQALAFLDTHQRPDGSWSGLVYDTATILLTLRRQNLANLVLEPVQLPDAPLAPAQDLQLVAGLSNQGGAPASAVRVQLLDADTGQLLAENNAPDLAPGQSISLPLSWTVAAPAGPRHLLLQALTSAPELLTADNRQPLEIQVLSQAADLYFQGDLLTMDNAYAGISAALPGNPILAGDLVHVTAMLVNGGLQAAGDTSVVLVRDAPDGAIVAGPISLGSLPGGGQLPVSLAWTTPDLPGSVLLYLKAETGDPEDQQGNNQVSALLETVARPTQGMVRLGTLSLDPPQFGQLPQTLTWTISCNNPGQTDLLGISLSLVPQASLNPLNGPFVFDLPAGGTLSQSFQLTLNQLRRYELQAHATLNSGTGPFLACQLVEIFDGSGLHEFSLSLPRITPNPSAVALTSTVAVDLFSANLNDHPQVPVRLEAVDGQNGISLIEARTTYVTQGSQTLSFSWTPQQPGPVTLRVVINGEAAIPELDPSDNLVEINVNVAADQQANLQLRSEELTFSPDPPVSGQALQLQLPLYNTGFQELGPFVVEVTLADPATTPPVLASQAFAGLPPGEQVALDLRLDPFLPGNAQTLYLRGVSAATELTLDDNLALRRLRAVNGPDLLLTAPDLAFQPALLVPDQPLTLSMSVQNRGDLASGPFVISLYAPTLAPNHLLAQIYADGVPAHDKSTFSQDLTLPGDLNQLIIQVDSDQQVAEYNEHNNQLLVPLHFRQGDFYADLDGFSPNGDGLHDQITFYYDQIGEATALHLRDDTFHTVATLHPHPPAGSIAWDGRNHWGTYVLDGPYTAILEEGGRERGRVSLLLDSNRIPLQRSLGGSVAHLLYQRAPYLLDAEPPGHDRLVVRNGPTIALFNPYDGQSYPLMEGFDEVPAQPRQLANEDQAVIFSPDGTKALYWTQADIHPSRSHPDPGRGARGDLGHFSLLDLQTGSTTDLRLDINMLLGASQCDHRFTFKVSRQHKNYITFSEDGNALFYYSMGDCQQGRTIPIRGKIYRYDLQTGEETALDLPSTGTPGYEDCTVALDYDIDTYNTPCGKTNIINLDGFGLFAWQGALYYNSNFVVGFSEEDEPCYGSGLPMRNALLRHDLTTGKTVPVWLGDRFYYRECDVVWGRGGYFNEGVKDFYGDPNTGDLYFVRYPYFAFELDQFENRDQNLETYRLSPGQDTAQLIFQPAPDPRRFRVRQQGPDSTVAEDSLDNLQNQLSLLNDPNAGIFFYGTASDRNLKEVRLDYALPQQPDQWFQIVPPRSRAVVRDLLGFWIPATADHYLVRVTVEDLVGNRTEIIRELEWTPAQLSVYELTADFEVISPNGDGRQDQLTLSYLVNQPASFPINIRDEVGNLVRTIDKVHAVAGAYQVFWDGKDDAQQPLPEGTYQIRVANQVSLTIALDRQAPVLSQQQGQPTRAEAFCEASGLPGLVLPLSWQVEDQSFATLELLIRDAAAGETWTRLTSFSQATGHTGLDLASLEAGAQIALRAVDRGGNLTLSQPVSLSQSLPPRIWIHDSGQGGKFCGPWLQGLQRVSRGKAGPLRFRFSLTGQAQLQSLRLTLKDGAGQVLSEETVPFSADPDQAIQEQSFQVDPGPLFLSNNAVLSAQTLDGQTLSSETFAFKKFEDADSSTTTTGSQQHGQDTGDKLRFIVHYQASEDCDDPGTLISQLWLPESAAELAALEQRLACTKAVALMGRAAGNDPVQRYNAYLDLVARQLPTELEVWVGGRRHHQVTFTEPGQRHEVPLDPQLLQEEGELELAIGVFIDQFTPTLLLTSEEPSCQVDTLLALLDQSASSPTVVDHFPFFQTRPVLDLPDFETGQTICADLEWHGSLRAPHLGHQVTTKVALIHLASQTPTAAVTLRKADSFGRYLVLFHSQALAAFAEDPLFQLVVDLRDLSGNCRQQTYNLRLDYGAQADLGPFEPQWLSPNGDGLQDQASLHYLLGEFMTSSHLIIAAAATPTIPVATLDLATARASGSYEALWDGSGQAGNLVPDGTYQVQLQVRDLCGNQKTQWDSIHVDRTPPLVRLDLPEEAAQVGGLLALMGQVADPNLAAFSLALSADGNQWESLVEGTSPANGLLGRIHLGNRTGPHFIRLEASDRAANSAIAQRAITIIPTGLLSYADLVPSHFSPNGDAILDQTTLELTFQAEAQARVQVLNSLGVPVRTLMDAAVAPQPYQQAWDGLDDSGQLLPDGAYQVVVSVSAGSLQEEAIFEAVLDTIAPQTHLDQPTPNLVTSQAEISLAYTIDELGPLTWVLTITNPNGQVTLQQGEGIQVQHQLQTSAEGLYNLTLSASDLAGNAAQHSTSLTLDRTPPLLLFLQPEPQALVNDGSPVLFTADDPDPVTYLLEWGAGNQPTSYSELQRAGPLPAGSFNHAWSAAGLPDGDYQIRVSLWDRAGNLARQEVGLTLDRTPPTLSLSQPQSGAFVGGQALDLRGSVADPHLAGYELYLAPGTPGQANLFSLLAAGTRGLEMGLLYRLTQFPADGPYTLKLEARDRVGHRAQALVGITVDRQPPHAPALQAQTFDQVNVQLSWNIPTGDPVSYQLFYNGSLFQQLSTTSYDHLELGNGIHVWQVAALDQAGNRSALSNLKRIEIDREPPTVSIINPQANARISGAVTFFGTAWDLAFQRYELRILDPDGGLLASLNADQPVQRGALYLWSSAPYEGAVLIQLQAWDSDGNQATTQVSVFCDNTPPAAPVLESANLDGSRVTLTWLANSEADLAGYRLLRNGVPLNPETPLITTSYIDDPVPDGTFNYNLVALDLAGQASAPSNTRTLTLDTHPPQLTLVQPLAGSRHMEPVPIVGQTEDRDISQVLVQGRAAEDTNWTLLATLTQPPFTSQWDLAGREGDFVVRLLATDTAGQTDPQPQQAQFSFGDTRPPAIASGLHAQVSGRLVTLDWEPVPDPDLAAYHILRNGEPLPQTSLQPTFADTVPAPGTYRFQVVAEDQSGNQGQPSEQVVVLVYQPALQETLPFADQPQLTLAGFAPVGLAFITITDPDGNLVTREPVPGGSQLFSTTLSGLPDGFHRYRIITEDDLGNISIPAASAVIIGAGPAAPVNLHAQLNGDQVLLSWDPVSQAHTYLVERNGSDLTSLIHPATVAATASAANGTPWGGCCLASFAADNNLTTYWMPPTGSESWLELTLASPVALARLDLRFKGRPLAFEVQVQHQSQWLTLERYSDTSSFPTSNRGDMTAAFYLAHPMLTDRVRLHFKQGWYQNFGGLLELYAHGYDAASAQFSDSPALNHIHTYSVRAVDALGRISPPALLAVPLGDTQPPEPPTGLSASLSDRNNVLLSWAASSDAQSYGLYRDTQFLAAITATHFTDLGLANATYTYHLTAYDAAGNESAPSNEASITIEAPIQVPGPTNLSLQVLDDGFQLEWQYDTTHPEFAHFALMRRRTGPGGLVASPPGSSFLDRDIFRDTTYFYQVAAVDIFGNFSPWSNPTSGRLSGEAPVFLYPGRSGSQVTLQQQATPISGTTEPAFNMHLLRDGSSQAITSALPDWTQLANLHDDGLGYYWDAGISPSGRYLAYQYVHDNGGPLIVYDLLENRELARLPSPSDNLAYFLFSPNETLLTLVTYQGVLSVWDLNSGQLWQLSTATEGGPHWAGPHTLAFTEETNLADGSRATQLKHWDLAERQLVEAVTLSGRVQLVPHEFQQPLFLTADNLLYRRLPSAPPQLIWSGAQQPNKIMPLDPQRFYIVTDDNLLLRLDPESGIEEQLWSRNSNWGYSFAVSPDERLFLSTYYYDDQALTFDARDGAQGTVPVGPEVWLAQFSPSGLLLLVSDQRVQVYGQPGHFAFSQVPLNPGTQVFTALGNAPKRKTITAGELTLTRAALEGPDLALTPAMVHVFPAVPLFQQQALAGVGVHNLGAWFVDRAFLNVSLTAPDGSVQLLLDHLPLENLAVDETRWFTLPWDPDQIGQWTLQASVLLDQASPEIDTENNHVQQVLSVAAEPDLQMITTLDNPSPQPNQSLTLAVDLLNAGPDQELRVETSLEDTSGQQLQLLDHRLFQPLRFAQSVLYHLSWVPGTTPAGDYRLRILASDPLNGQVIRENVLALNVPADHQLVAQLALTEVLVNRGQPVNLLVDLQNLSGNYTYRNLLGKLSFRQGGTLYHQATLNPPLLPPGSSHQASWRWFPPPQPLGSWTVTLEILEGDQLRAQDSRPFELTYQPVYDLNIRLDNLPGQTTAAATWPVQLQLTNTGNTDLQGAALTARLGQDIVGQQTFDLAVGDRLELSLPLNLEQRPLGDYDVSLAVSFPNGQTVQALSRLSLIDAAAPRITISGVYPDQHSNNLITPLISVTDDSPVTTAILLNDLPFLSNTPVTNDGAYLLRVSAVDSSGNSAQQQLSFSIDKIPPQITVSGIAHGASVAPPVNLQIQVTDANPVQVETQLNGTTWQQGTLVADGDYQLSINAADNHGNISHRQLNFELISHPPAITIEGLANQFNNHPLQPSISIQGGHILSQSSLLNGQSFNSGSLLQQEGSYDLQVSATNGFGSSQEQRHFIIDTTPPLIEISGLQDGDQLPGPVLPQISVTDDWPAEQAEILLDGQPWPGTPISEPGSHQLQIQAQDLAGNQTSASLVFTLTLPSPSLVAQTDRASYAGWDTAFLQATLHNPGQTTLPAQSLEFSLWDSTAQLVARQSETSQAIPPQDSATTSLRFELVDALAGSWTLEVNLLSEPGGQILDQARTSFEVVRQPLQALQADLQLQSSTLNRGQTFTRFDRLFNRSSWETLQLDILRQVQGPDGQLLEQLVGSLPLNPGQEQILQADHPTADWPIGAGTCLLLVASQGQNTELARAGFTLEQPAATISAQLDQPSDGRLLILADSQWSNPPGWGDEDPFGPAGFPLLSEQWAFLEELFSARQHAFTLCDNEADFRDHLNGGSYQTILILSEHLHLGKTTLDQLREAVYRGENLWVAGLHDGRLTSIQEPLGIQLGGRQGPMETLQLHESQVYLAHLLELPMPEDIMRVSGNGADSLAAFQAGDSLLEGAITGHLYGWGAAIFMGFDLLGQTTLAGFDSPFQDLFTQTLTWFAEPGVPPLPGRALPLRLRVSAGDQALSGQALIQLPQGLTVLDSGRFILDENEALWTFDLEPGQTGSAQLWVTAQQPGSWQAMATIQADQQIIESEPMELIFVQTRPPEDARALLSSLESRYRKVSAYKNAGKELDKAFRELDKGRLDKAVDNLLKAADHLAKLSELPADGAEARRIMAQFLRTLLRHSLSAKTLYLFTDLPRLVPATHPLPDLPPVPDPEATIPFDSAIKKDPDKKPAPKKPDKKPEPKTATDKRRDLRFKGKE